VEESLAEGAFGMHSFDDLTAFCIKKSYWNIVWVGGKDDWFVIWYNRRYSTPLVITHDGPIWNKSILWAT
jgi:hypothetical protein